MEKSPPASRVAMLVDEWFPSNNRKVGTFGGTQVRVRQIKKYLEEKHNYRVILFYQSHQNLFIRILWPFIAFIDIILYNRYHKLSLIHVHGTWSALPAKLASIILDIPIIYTVHNSPQLAKKSSTIKKIWEQFILTKISYTKQITIAKSFLNHKNVNQDPVFIPNGVNVAAYNRVKVKKNHEPTLIWVGKNSPSKGLNILKNAIVKVRKKIPNLQAELVADGRITGRELIKAYKKSHVFVLASLIESQPITILEAWAAQLPVVVTDVGDLSSMVKHGKNGYLVEPDNAQQLALYILKILRARVSSEKMAQSGYEWVRSHYSWQKVAKETHLVYQDALSIHLAKKKSSQTPASTPQINPSSQASRS